SKFDIFISNVPFPSNDPAVLKSSSSVVWQAYTPDVVGRVTNFLVQNAFSQPITGRFVRIQREGTAALVLSEVQIFGRDHVEPDRYPRAVRENAVLGDGWFQAEIYDRVTNTWRWLN